MADPCGGRHVYEVISESSQGTYMNCRFCKNAPVFIPKEKGGGT